METPEQLVQRQLDAYNRHDLEAFLATYRSDIEILKFPTNEVVLAGMDALRTSYAERFRPGSRIQAELVGRITIGSQVIDRERVTGLKDGEAIEAVAIYQVEEGLITKVWFIRTW